MKADTQHLFARVLQAEGLPLFHPEFRFCERRWRFDYAWPDQKLALEVEGGAFTNGRHTRGSGFIKDMEKYNAAVLAGWRVLRVTPNTLLVDGPDLVRKALRCQ